MPDYETNYDFTKGMRQMQDYMQWISEQKGHTDLQYDYDTLDAMRLIALMITEASEMLQLVKRHGFALADTNFRAEFEEELADLVIRAMQFAAHYGLNLPGAVIKKNAKNLERPYKYGTPEEKSNDAPATDQP